MHQTWRKSSHSGNEGNCVEVAIERTVGVRDSKAPAAGQLTVSRQAWSAALRRLR
ncbi:protein of unknown function [Amycolatopsis pretoriensis]|uniref:DUF397 domain-containing protein n=1 Tax=Amycolatopsis pretoriensis TaxID=218821 RepID=A0A1H5R404_9PSEU|nr:DUF397 domain-containing protein [Amycolatopsis pretoriensis]SEF33136.1 protein of unknown function [Amycolatopsis pretoriensis]